MRSPTILITAVRLVLLTLLSAVPSLSAQTQSLSRWETQARDLLKELIEHNTTESAGDMTAAAAAMARHLRAAGFAEEDITIVASGQSRKGNLVVRLRGKNRSLKPILLLSHIDVVEAKPEDWTLPPFQFIERDGTFFGRGVADDKDEGAIHLTILLRLKAEGWIPERDVIVALTTDEEGGPENGVRWLLENRRDLVDAEYVLNEGGGGRMREGERLSNDVQASEKKVLNVQLEVTNSGGHSSVPVPDNAIYHLARALDALSQYHFPVRLNEVTRTFFTGSAAQVPPRLAQAMRRLTADESDAEAAAVLAEVPAYNSQLRTTCVATMLDGGHARNALPQRARATVNCRLLPDENPARVLAVFDSLIGNDKVKITPLTGAQDSPPSPLTPALMGAITEVTEAMWPGIPVLPTMSTGATDGLYFRNAGIPVYGVSGLFYENANAHGMNEQISSRSFYEGLEFMYRLVKRLTGGGVI